MREIPFSRQTHATKPFGKSGRQSGEIPTLEATVSDAVRQRALRGPSGHQGGHQTGEPDNVQHPPDMALSQILPTEPASRKFAAQVSAGQHAMIEVVGLVATAFRLG